MASTHYNDQAVIRQYLTRAKRMRLFSTPESTERGEVTLLALAETLAAVSVSWWIAIRYDTVTHIVIGAAIAPLLLLRTRLSTRLALYWSRRDSRIHRTIISMVDTLDDNARPLILRKFAIFPMIPIGWFLLLLSVRLVATCVVSVRKFNSTLCSIPGNWRRYALALDMHHPPEPLPGLELSGNEHPLRNMRLTTAVKSLANINWPLRIVCGVIFFPVIYLPSFLYRFSLKSTSLVYLPFVWIIHSHVGESLSGKEHLNDIETGKLERLQRWYAGLIVATSVASLAVTTLPIVVLHNIYTDGGDVVRVLLDLFIPTNGLVVTFKGWHLARLANAAIVLYLFFHADKASRRIASGRWTDEQVKGRIELTRHIQMALALYTMFCTLSRLVQFAIWDKLPPVEFQFFP